MTFVLDRREPIRYETDFTEPNMFRDETDFQRLMLEITKRNASETILQPYEPVLIEIDGILRPLTQRRLTPDEVEMMVNWAAGNDKAKAELIQRREVKASYVVKDPVERDARGEKVSTRYRVAAGRGELRGSMAFQILLRRINSVPAYLKDADLPDYVIDAMTMGHGVTWVSGRTGSGKTTFFSSIIRYILENATAIKGNIILLEEPIEQVYDTIDSKHSVVFQIEVGRDVDSWEQGIEQLMRRLPAMILVGETRSRITAEAVLQAANTGHPVGSTLHANDVAGIIPRLMTFFADDLKEQMLFDALDTARVMFNQVRVPKVGGGMTVLREYLVVTDELRRELQARSDPTKIAMHMREALEEHGKPMWQAAQEAFDAGIIDTQTLRIHGKRSVEHVRH